MDSKNIIIIGLILVALPGWLAWWRSSKANVALTLPAVSSDLMPALQNRASTARADFTREAVSEEDLLKLAWAATGKNRDGNSGYTVPLAMGSDPYVDVYLYDQNGIRRYDYDNNGFVDVSSTDARADIMMMSEIADIPQMMVFVINPDKLPGGNPDTTYGYVAVGAMTQNVYLLAEQLGVQRRYIASIKADGIKTSAGLADNQIPVAAVILARGETKLTTTRMTPPAAPPAGELPPMPPEQK
ncbi:nitroreductase family protein [bacterium]|nr:nitroreductase family protein [bacterium]